MQNQCIWWCKDWIVAKSVLEILKINIHCCLPASCSHTSWNFRFHTCILLIHSMERLISIIILHYLDPNNSRLDTTTFASPSAHHVACQWLISYSSSSIRCSMCIQLRATLMVQSKWTEKILADTSHSSCTNFRCVYHIFI